MSLKTKTSKRPRRMIDILPVQPQLKLVMEHLQTLWDRPVDITETARWSIIQTHKQLTHD